MGSFIAVAITMGILAEPPDSVVVLRVDDQVREFLFSPSGQWFAIRTRSHVVVWNLRAHAVPETTLRFKADGLPTHIAFSADSRWLVSGHTAPLNLALCDLSARPLATEGFTFADRVGLPDTPPSIYELQFSPDNQRLVVWLKSWEIGVWHLTARPMTATLLPGASPARYALRVSNRTVVAEPLINGGETDRLTWDLTQLSGDRSPIRTRALPIRDSEYQYFKTLGEQWIALPRVPARVTRVRSPDDLCELHLGEHTADGFQGLVVWRKDVK